MIQLKNRPIIGPPVFSRIQTATDPMISSSSKSDCGIFSCFSSLMITASPLPCFFLYFAIPLYCSDTARFSAIQRVKLLILFHYTEFPGKLQVLLLWQKRQKSRYRFFWKSGTFYAILYLMRIILHSDTKGIFSCVKGPLLYSVFCRALLRPHACAYAAVCQITEL